MKLFHLSDLHLGKRLNEFSLIEDQRHILRQILRAADAEQPDGILIAGDIYDRSVPAEEAMRLWDDFLKGLADRHLPVFAISGNHDSAIRFSDHGRLMESTGIHLAPVYDGTVSRFSLSDAYGEVHIYLLPFIKPATVRPLFPDAEIETYTDACRTAVEHMGVDPSARNILVAHQFVTGAVRCESEEVVVGGLDNVDASVFDAFDYAALGHLHGAQSIGRETVRYCGTPLKYSFSEKDQTKSVTVVELSGKGDIRIRTLPLTPLRDLREIRGSFEEITGIERAAGKQAEDYLHVILTDEDDVPEAMARLRHLYPNLMKLSYDNHRTREQQDIEGATRVESRSPMELFEEFYEKQNNMPMHEEQRKLVRSCIAEIWEEQG
ncbi:MAG: exonuclease SbcCD subunit D [Lachnospiraceae bacterium]|nr:exonuclease SbcCD subunit D [Lachnospiraceae bacterium]